MKPTSKDRNFNIVKPRDTVEINLPDGRAISGPRGEQVGSFLQILSASSEYPIVGAIVNHQLRELTYPIEMDSTVVPVSMNDAETIHCPARLKRAEPGKIITSRPPLAVNIFFSFFWAILRRNPLSSDWWIAS